MKIGMIGLGRMGGDMVRRLMRAGHDCVVFDKSADSVAALAGEGAKGTHTLQELVTALTAPRALWMMVPAAVVDDVIEDLEPLLDEDDTLVDGGNSYYADDLRRADRLAKRGIHYVDVGTSGGIWGLDRGYCQMIGGEDSAVQRLEPIFDALAPPADSVTRTPGREGAPSQAERGYLHCGGPGAGHFVKMVHNGIEYGLMAAYAEGMNVLRHANAGKSRQQEDAETAPMHDFGRYAYDLDIGEIAELWRRGSVISSWLLDLTAGALRADPQLDDFTGHVSDSGEGRWTVKAAVDEGVPVPVLSAALYQRFSSRGASGFANRILSAMRSAFGGHAERT
jgi:6-phosphogluconate dehydrogenase